MTLTYISAYTTAGQSIQFGAKKKARREEPGFPGVWLNGPQNHNLKWRDHPYGLRVAGFPFLKIGSGVYFPFTNTVI
jgi:hypothetical protein